jgi:nicotinamidase-related amidase
MPAKNNDLHGSTPDTCPVALLLIDVVNDLEFPGGDQLLHTALPAAHQIATLKERARAANVPVIYANDNFGRWRSDFRAVVQHCLETDVRGRPIVQLLRPAEDDYFVLKPKHSSFFASTLETLLEYLGTKTLVIAGFTGDICVLFTANDAYMRDYHIVVPSDCVASIDPDENQRALAYMHRVLRADTRFSTDLCLDELIAGVCAPQTYGRQ